MRNFSKLLGIIALVAIMFVVVGCTTTSIGGTAEPHGLISGLMVDKNLNEGSKVESYMVILGLVNIGYPDYATAVKAAEAQGRQITSISRNWFGIVNISTAYAK